MRYGIDATTLLHVLDHDLPLDPSHQLVAPSTIRSEALGILLADVRAGRRTENDALALHERITELKMRVLGDRVVHPVRCVSHGVLAAHPHRGQIPFR